MHTIQRIELNFELIASYTEIHTGCVNARCCFYFKNEFPILTFLFNDEQHYSLQIRNYFFSQTSENEKTFIIFIHQSNTTHGSLIIIYKLVTGRLNL